MSIKNVEKFLNLVKSNESLRKELILINEKLQKEEGNEEKIIADNVVPLAKKNGIIFTANDFLHYANEQMSALSEEDLLNVSGGANAKRTAAAWLFAGITAASFAAPAAQKFLSEQPTSSVTTGSKNQSSEKNSRNNQDEVNTGAQNAADKMSNPGQKSAVNKGNNKGNEAQAGGNIAHSDNEASKANDAEQKNRRDVMQNKNVVLPNSNAKNTPVAPQINVAPQANAAKPAAKNNVAPQANAANKQAAKNTATTTASGTVEKANRINAAGGGKTTQTNSEKKSDKSANPGVGAKVDDKATKKNERKVPLKKDETPKEENKKTGIKAENKKENKDKVTMPDTAKEETSKATATPIAKEAAPVQAKESAAEARENKCGENLTWEIEGNVLHISGKGPMDDYTYYYSGNEDECAPWYNQRNSIQKVVIGENVTTIGKYAFEDCKNLTSVEIPNSVTSIKYGAFSGCEALKSVAIPDSVRSFGENIFKNTGVNFGEVKCELSGLEKEKTLTISGQGPIYDIDEDSLWGDEDPDNITKVVIMPGITSIGEAAFSYLKNLTSVEIPEGVRFIGTNAFEECSSLTSVEIPASVTAIGKCAFAGCSSLTSVNIPEGVTTIGDNAFSGCSSLTSVKIPDGVTKIEQSTFRGCSSLTSVTIPEGVTTIGSNAFEGCSSLTSVKIPDGVTTIESRTFEGCSSLTSVTIPASVKWIYNSAFADCSSLTSVTIPEGVETIERWAFSGCSSLKSITIPASVNLINDNAFYGCSSLNSVKIFNNNVNDGNGVFGNCNELKEVEMPRGYRSGTFSGLPVKTAAPEEEKSSALVDFVKNNEAAKSDVSSTNIDDQDQNDNDNKNDEEAKQEEVNPEEESLKSDASGTVEVVNRPDAGGLEESDSKSGENAAAAKPEQKAYNEKIDRSSTTPQLHEVRHFYDFLKSIEDNNGIVDVNAITPDTVDDFKYDAQYVVTLLNSNEALRGSFGEDETDYIKSQLKDYVDVKEADYAKANAWRADTQLDHFINFSQKYHASPETQETWEEELDDLDSKIKESGKENNQPIYVLYGGMRTYTNIPQKKLRFVKKLAEGVKYETWNKGFTLNLFSLVANNMLANQAEHLIGFLNGLPKIQNNLPDLSKVSRATRTKLKNDIIHVGSQVEVDDQVEYLGSSNPNNKKVLCLSGRVFKNSDQSQQDLYMLRDLYRFFSQEEEISDEDDRFEEEYDKLTNEHREETQSKFIKKKVIDDDDRIDDDEDSDQVRKVAVADTVGGQEDGINIKDINATWKDLTTYKEVVDKDGKVEIKVKTHKGFEGQTPMSYLNSLPRTADGLPDIGRIEDPAIRKFFIQIINEIGRNIIVVDGIIYCLNSELVDGLGLTDDDLKMMLLLYNKLNNDALELLKSLPQKKDGSADLSKGDPKLVDKLVPAINLVGEQIVYDEEFGQYKFVGEKLKKDWFGDIQVDKKTEYTKIFNLSQDDLKLLYKTREALPEVQKVSFVKILNDLPKTAERDLPDLNQVVDPTTAMYLRLNVFSLSKQITENKDGSYSVSDEARDRFSLTADDVKTIKILGDKQAKIEKSYNRKQTAIGVAQGVTLGAVTLGLSALPFAPVFFSTAASNDEATDIEKSPNTLETEGFDPLGKSPATHDQTVDSGNPTDGEKSPNTLEAEEFDPTGKSPATVSELNSMASPVPQGQNVDSNRKTSATGDFTVDQLDQMFLEGQKEIQRSQPSANIASSENLPPTEQQLQDIYMSSKPDIDRLNQRKTQKYDTALVEKTDFENNFADAEKANANKSINWETTRQGQSRPIKNVDDRQSVEFLRQHVGENGLAEKPIKQSLQEKYFSKDAVTGFSEVAKSSWENIGNAGKNVINEGQAFLNNLLNGKSANTTRTQTFKHMPNPTPAPQSGQPKSTELWDPNPGVPAVNNNIFEGEGHVSRETKDLINFGENYANTNANVKISVDNFNEPKKIPDFRKNPNITPIEGQETIPKTKVSPGVGDSNIRNTEKIDLRKLINNGTSTANITQNVRPAIRTAVNNSETSTQQATDGFTKIDSKVNTNLPINVANEVTDQGSRFLTSKNPEKAEISKGTVNLPQAGPSKAEEPKSTPQVDNTVRGAKKLNDADAKMLQNPDMNLGEPGKTGYSTSNWSEGNYIKLGNINSELAKSSTKAEVPQKAVPKGQSNYSIKNDAQRNLITGDEAITKDSSIPRGSTPINDEFLKIDSKNKPGLGDIELDKNSATNKIEVKPITFAPNAGSGNNGALQINDIEFTNVETPKPVKGTDDFNLKIYPNLNDNGNNGPNNKGNNDITTPTGMNPNIKPETTPVAKPPVNVDGVDIKIEPTKNIEAEVPQNAAPGSMTGYSTSNWSEENYIKLGNRDSEIAKNSNKAEAPKSTLTPKEDANAAKIFNEYTSTGSTPVDAPHSDYVTAKTPSDLPSMTQEEVENTLSKLLTPDDMHHFDANAKTPSDLPPMTQEEVKKSLPKPVPNSEKLGTTSINDLPPTQEEIQKTLDQTVPTTEEINTNKGKGQKIARLDTPFKVNPDRDPGEGAMQLSNASENSKIMQPSGFNRNAADEENKAMPVKNSSSNEGEGAGTTLKDKVEKYVSDHPGATAAGALAGVGGLGIAATALAGGAKKPSGAIIGGNAQNHDNGGNNNQGGPGGGPGGSGGFGGGPGGHGGGGHGLDGSENQDGGQDDDNNNQNGNNLFGLKVSQNFDDQGQLDNPKENDNDNGNAEKAEQEELNSAKDSVIVYNLLDEDADDDTEKTESEIQKLAKNVKASATAKGDTAKTHEGNCGKNVTWEIKENVLYISGEGPMENYNNSSAVPWTSYKDEITKVVIGPNVTAIGKRAFMDCSNVSEVTISESVTMIEAEAFKACSNLTSITIPKNVTSIGEFAFAGCTKLRFLEIYTGVKSIGSYSFSHCKSLGSITIPASVETIKSNAFNNCSGLTSVTILGVSFTVAEDAFDDCNKLEKFDVPANFENDELCGKRVEKAVPNEAIVRQQDQRKQAERNPSLLNRALNYITGTRFSGKCGENVNYTLNKDYILTISGSGPMEDYGDPRNTPWSHYAEKIRKIVIEEGVTSIGENTFSTCVGLREVTISESVKTIEAEAFSGCSSLTEVTIPKNVETIKEHAFGDCVSLREITIPESVTEIENNAFSNCVGVKKIIIQSENLKIGNCAFINCEGVEFVIIEKDVVNFGDGAFYNLASLNSFIYEGNWKPIFGENVLGKCDNLEEITVSAGYEGNRGDDFGGKPVNKEEAESEEDVRSDISQPEKNNGILHWLGTPFRLAGNLIFGSKSDSEEDTQPEEEAMLAVTLDEFNGAFNELKDQDYDVDREIAISSKTKETVEHFARTNVAALKPINDALKNGNENGANSMLTKLKYENGIVVDGDKDNTLEQKAGKETSKKKRRDFTKLGVVARFACEWHGEEGGIIDNPQEIKVLHHEPEELPAPAPEVAPAAPAPAPEPAPAPKLDAEKKEEPAPAGGLGGLGGMPPAAEPVPDAEGEEKPAPAPAPVAAQPAAPAHGLVPGAEGEKEPAPQPVAKKKNRKKTKAERMNKDKSNVSAAPKEQLDEDLNDDAGSDVAPAQEALPLTYDEAFGLLRFLQARPNLRLDPNKNRSQLVLLERFVKTNLEELRKNAKNPVFSFEGTSFDKKLSGVDVSKNQRGKTSSQLLQDFAYANFKDRIINES